MKTPDSFFTQKIPKQKAIEKNGEYVRLEYDSLCYYSDANCTIRHREYGPARIFNNGCQEFWVNGLLHRLNDAAIFTAKGKKVYYLFGRRLSAEQWTKAKEKYNLNYDADYSIDFK